MCLLYFTDFKNILCPICGGCINQSSNAHATPCGHLAHYECFYTWLRRIPSCPVCRKECNLSKVIKMHFQFGKEVSITNHPSYTSLVEKNVALEVELKALKEINDSGKKDVEKLLRKNEALEKELNCLRVVSQREKVDLRKEIGFLEKKVLFYKRKCGKKELTAKKIECLQMSFRRVSRKLLAAKKDVLGPRNKRKNDRSERDSNGNELAVISVDNLHSNDSTNLQRTSSTHDVGNQQVTFSGNVGVDTMDAETNVKNEAFIACIEEIDLSLNHSNEVWYNENEPTQLSADNQSSSNSVNCLETTNSSRTHGVGSEVTLPENDDVDRTEAEINVKNEAFLACAEEIDLVSIHCHESAAGSCENLEASSSSLMPIFRGDKEIVEETNKSGKEVPNCEPNTMSFCTSGDGTNANCSTSSESQQLVNIQNKDNVSSVNSGNELYVCDRCKKAFSQKTNLILHIRVHKKPRLKQKLTAGNKITQMKLHNVDKPYFCDQCDKSFSQKGNLNRHIRFHTGVKNFVCDDCGKACSFKSSLITHMRVHTGAKPFACDDCEKAFSVKSNLERHRRVHTGDRPYACDQCDRGFRRKDDLVKHIRVHTGEKPFSCGVCNRAFARKHHLNGHMRVHK